MNTKQKCILLFTRYPRAGTSKTRLIPSLGKEGAADLQRKMTETVLHQIEQLQAHGSYDLRIYYTGADKTTMRQWLGSNGSYEEQCHGDLGKRMYHAFSSHLNAYLSVVLVGSDCPSIDAKLLDEAFKTLETHDLVLGPAYDGGYYLIGFSTNISPQSLASIFTGIHWGQSDVLQQTLAHADRLQFSYRLLKKLHDIDTPADLVHFNHHTDT
ncbi:MAG: TIGR04282 family arsenosugar biosynthesis glycosyltransferase [Desulfopila sp.]|nr:TIGR04282 family arsenosugar biosynthesis glycosyltransferase [Desulfopila sp.]